MIRLGTKEDLIQIDTFDIFGGDREEDIAEARLQVYVIGDRIVGYIVAIDNSCLCGHSLISFLCVHSDYRRQGIASELLGSVEMKYKEKKLFISTESNNSAMLKLIEQRNYIKAGSLANINDDGSDEIYFYREA